MLLSLLTSPQGIGEGQHHVEGHGVHALGPVQRDQRDVGPGVVDQYEVVCGGHSRRRYQPPVPRGTPKRPNQTASIRLKFRPQPISRCG